MMVGVWSSISWDTCVGDKRPGRADASDLGAHSSLDVGLVADQTVQ